jgi:hypothetical protein
MFAVRHTARPRGLASATCPLGLLAPWQPSVQRLAWDAQFLGFPRASAAAQGARCALRADSLPRAPGASGWHIGARPRRRCARCAAPRRACLTSRSTGPATAGQLGPVGGTLYILANRTKPSCRVGPVTSNVRPHSEQCSSHSASSDFEISRIECARSGCQGKESSCQFSHRHQNHAKVSQQRPVAPLVRESAQVRHLGGSAVVGASRRRAAPRSQLVGRAACGRPCRSAKPGQAAL